MSSSPESEIEVRKPKPPLFPAKEAVLVFAVSILSFPLVLALSVGGYTSIVESHLYVYGTTIEFLFVGFLPMILALRDNDNRELYGISLVGAVTSVGLGISLVAVRAAFRFAAGLMPFQVGLAAFSQSLVQPFPYSPFFAVITIFTYGPLEVFFVTFLVVKLDLAFGPARGKVLTKGLLIGVLFWALLHLGNGVFYGVSTAAGQVASNFIYGVLLIIIFKYSKCSLGTMMSFTITNLAQ